MITMKVETFEYVEMIARRLNDRWDYPVFTHEFDAMIDYFDGCCDLPVPDVIADNYYVNGDRGYGADLVDRKALENMIEFLLDCALVWGRDLVEEILEDDSLSKEEKEEKIKNLSPEDFGFCYVF